MPGAGWYKRVNGKIAIWATAAIGLLSWFSSHFLQADAGAGTRAS